MNRRRLLASGAALAAATVISSRARAEVLKFRLGHVDPPNSYSGVGVEAFAKEVQTRSNGAMEVAVFHAGALGAIPDENERTCSPAPAGTHATCCSRNSAPALSRSRQR